MFARLLAIACGGAAGAVLRYLVAGWGQRLAGGEFPVGTLLVNIIGCGVIGLLATAFHGRILISEELRFAILVGVLGGFTTFSTFALDAVTLTDAGQWLRAGSYVLASNAVGFAAAFGGVTLARWLGWS